MFKKRFLVCDKICNFRSHDLSVIFYPNYGIDNIVCLWYFECEDLPSGHCFIGFTFLPAVLNLMRLVCPLGDLQAGSVCS